VPEAQLMPSAQPAEQQPLRVWQQALGVR